MTTVSTSITCNAIAYQTFVFVYGDGEAGSWSNVPCLNDAPLCWPEIDNPSATVDSPCPGEPFTLTGDFASAANCGVNATWTGPNGFFSNDLITTAPSEGTYTLSLNLSGCTTLEVDVNAQWTGFQPTLSPSPQATFCFGETITLTGTGGDSYVFTSPNGTIYNTNPVTVIADGTHDGIWTMVASSGASCQSTLITDITVLPELMVTADAMPQPVCVGDDITLTGNGAGPGGTYTWGGDAPPSTNNPHTFQVTTPGNYIATLTVTDAGGCPATINVPYSVGVGANISIVASDQSVCAGDQIDLVASGGGTYSWSPGGQTTQSISVFPNTTTTYTVNVITPEGCLGDESITIDVQSLLPPPQIQCQPSDAATITWSWTTVPGADFYRILIDGALVEANWPGTSYTLTGLDPGTSREITVIPFSNNNVDCPGQAAVLSCASAECNPIFYFLETPQVLCYDPTSGPVLMILGVSGQDASQGQAVWTGTGFFGPSPTPANWFPPGPGTYTLTASFTLNNGTCPYSEDFVFTVNPAADPNITGPSEACTDGNYTYQVTNTPGATYDWNFGLATVNGGNGAGPYDLSFPTPGTYTIELTTTLGDCQATDSYTIEVDDPLLPPEPFCQFIDDESVTFAWNPVAGATNYVIDVISNHTGTQDGNTFTVTGLVPEESVTITVTAEGDVSCPATVSAQTTCTARFCPDVTVEIDNPSVDFCATGISDPVDLSANVSSSLPVTQTVWSGNGVIGNTFDPDSAGIGQHVVTVTVIVDECPFDTTRVFTVRPLPTADFTISGPVCVDGPSIVTYTGDADPATATFDWDFGGANVLSGNGGGPYELSFPTAGRFPISLVVTDDFCSSQLFSDTLTVIEPLAPPVVSCVDPQLDGMTFEWVVDTLATGYEVVLLDGPAGVQNGNTYVVSGVGSFDSVTIRVIAEGPPPCGNSNFTEIRCGPRICDSLVVTIDPIAVTEFCEYDTTDFVVLTATVSDGHTSGITTWAGPGVSNDTFYVADAPVGTSEIIVTYEDIGCFYFDTIDLTVFPTPDPAFTLDRNVICVGDTVILTNEVAQPPNAGYVWDFDGGLAEPGSGAAPQAISWATAGTKEITLTLTINGCVAEASATVEVIEPLPAPVPVCGVTDLNNVTIDWADVAGNLGYAVSINGGAATVVDTNSFTVTGLTPDSLVNVSVAALGADPCGGSAAAEIDCAAAPCPDLTINLDGNTEAFCLDVNADQSTTLVASIDGGLNNGTFTYAGPGVSGDVFDPAVAGVGLHTILVTYQEAGPCLALDSFVIDVFSEPVADFSIAPADACLTDTVVVTFTGTAASGTVYNWDFAGATVLSGNGAGPYQLQWPTSGDYAIDLSIDAPGNCSAVSPTRSLTITDPLEPLVVDCIASDRLSVTFGWNAVAGSTGYEVSYDGQLDTLSGLSYLIEGLLPDSTVQISVRALGPPPCGDGASVGAECSTPSCPVIELDIATTLVSFCLNTDPFPVELIASSSGGDQTGDFVWSGPGVIQDANGFRFDAATAGAGSHVLTVNYVETGGCAAVDSLTMNVFDGPFAAIDLAASPICRTDFTTIGVVGTDLDGASFSWDFDGGTATETSPETYTVSWDAAGTYTVVLNVAQNGCFAADTVNVEVIEPLVAPQPFCDTVELTRIIFTWPTVAGATGYRLSVNGGTPFAQADTTYEVSSLGESETVTLTVTALGLPPCGDSAPATVSCTTDPCPEVELQPTVGQTEFCTATNYGLIPLTFSAMGGFGGGTAVWSGTGVVSNPDGTYAFDPANLSPGEYLLTLDYQEVICPFSVSLVMQVFATPEVSFATSLVNLCSTSTTTVSFTGTAEDNAAYDWNFAGATVTPLGNETYELNWADAGSYLVQLTVSQNGCDAAFETEIAVSEPPLAGQQFAPADICAQSGEIIPLFSLLTGADPGGTWAPAVGSPATVDPTTGSFNSANLAAGTYEYVYTVDGGFCPSVSTSVFVTIQPAPAANAGVSQTLTCAMGTVSLSGAASTAPGNGPLTYAWTGPDGSPPLTDADQAMIDVTLPGMYTLTVTSALGCTATDQVEVIADTETPVPAVELNDISCFTNTDGTILVTGVTGGRPPYRYALNGGPAGNTTFFTQLDAGEYSLRVTDANGCFSELFLDISRPDQLGVSIELPEGNEYTPGERVIARAEISGGTTISSIVWQPDSLNLAGEGQSNVITLIASQTQTISVTVTDENGCRASDQMTILVRRDESVYIPTGFTPNGDNTNDILFIGADPDEVRNIRSFLIFNRWGESVFENYNFQPNSPAQGWDGNHRNEPMNPAVFVYVAEVEMMDGTIVVYKGDVTLIR